MTHRGLLPHGYRRRGNGTPIACERSPTGAAPIDNTTFNATLIINSDICHSEYIQPGWFFCVNCHGRYPAGDAPNGLAGTEVRLAHGVAPWVLRRLVEQSQLVARREGLSGFAREFWLWWLKLGGRKS
jgi:hypothetical protein